MIFYDLISENGLHFEEWFPIPQNTNPFSEIIGKICAKLLELNRIDKKNLKKKSALQSCSRVWPYIFFLSVDTRVKSPRSSSGVGRHSQKSYLLEVHDLLVQIIWLPLFSKNLVVQICCLNCCCFARVSRRHSQKSAVSLKVCIYRGTYLYVYAICIYIIYTYENATSYVYILCTYMRIYKYIYYIHKSECLSEVWGAFSCVYLLYIHITHDIYVHICTFIWIHSYTS